MLIPIRALASRIIPSTLARAMELINQILIASSKPTNPSLRRVVIYIVHHDRFGTAGLIINQPTHARVSDIMTHMDIEHDGIGDDRIVLDGGPVDNERGFVLHSPVDYWQNTAAISSHVALTTSQDMMAAIAGNEAPPNYLFTLGHCRWAGNKLEQEIRNNHWLLAPATRELLFHTPYSERYQKALGLAGVRSSIALTEFAGHA